MTTIYSTRLEYTDEEECMLRLTEIQSILENNLYENEEKKQDLLKEIDALEEWKRINAPNFQ